MPVRIYSLAKDLKLDSKQLVDLCTKAGITGKGSALASLTDEEVEKLQAYLNRGRESGGREVSSRDAGSTERSVGAPIRPTAPAPPSRPPTLSSRTSSPAAASSPAAVAPTQPAVSSSDETPPTVPPAPATPSTPAPSGGIAAHGDAAVSAGPAAPAVVSPGIAAGSGSGNAGVRPSMSSSGGIAPAPTTTVSGGSAPTSSGGSGHAGGGHVGSGPASGGSPLSHRGGGSGGPTGGSGAGGSVSGAAASGGSSLGTPGPLSAHAAGVKPGPMSRDEYISPGGTSGGKPRMLGSRPVRGPGGGQSSSSRDSNRPQGGRRETVVKLAAMPKTPENLTPRGPAEPAAQKPIMTLPLDAIRGAKSGSAAPLEQFTKQQEKKRKEKDQKERDKDKEVGVKKGVGRRGMAEELPPLEADALSPAGHRDRKKPKTDEVLVEDEEGKGRRLAGMANARVARQQSRRRKDHLGVEEEEGDASRPASAASASARRRQVQSGARGGGSNTAAPRKGRITVELPCTVRSLSEATGVPFSQIQRTLMSLGTMATINSSIDADLAELVAAELGLDIELRQPPSLEDKLLEEIRNRVDDPEKLLPRPPVVTFLGHVDHGKTSLLDRILGINVVSGEAGGITQHIRAYSVDKDGRRISFVDTPGHEAFTEMRARGAHVTDIAVLVVAADDGVMPQTEEAISHAKAAGVPIVVALNKIDLPGANPVKAMQDLTQHELLPTEWGGDVEVIKTSAITGAGIDDLLETLLLTAEIHEYRANPERPALGTCLEAQQEGDRGVVAKLIVQNGTLRVGDIVVCGAGYGRVKAMTDPLHPRQRITSAGPSVPVNVTGLDSPPEAGEPFYVLDNITDARAIAEKRAAEARGRSLAGRKVRVSFEEFQKRMEQGNLGGQHEPVILNLILRADVRGSIEALEKELAKLDHPEVRINLLQRSVGGVTSADVTLAAASDAVIVGFNVIPDEAARQLADERGVEIRRYDIIYKVTEDLKAMLEGKLKPEEHVKELGRALVQRVYMISRVGAVAGCRVLAGTVERGCRIRVNRDGRGIGDYAMDSLKREKDDAREVREGMECGIKLSGFNDLKEGDILEAYKIEEVARTL